MTRQTRRVVTGHDAGGKSVILTDGPSPQHHEMRGVSVGAEFFEMWSDSRAVPLLTSAEAREPNEREFTIMPVAGHLLRILDIYPPKGGGKRTVMHRTSTLDYVVVIEGEVILLLDDSEVALKAGDVVVQRGAARKVAKAAGAHALTGVFAFGLGLQCPRASGALPMKRRDFFRHSLMGSAVALLPFEPFLV